MAAGAIGRMSAGVEPDFAFPLLLANQKSAANAKYIAHNSAIRGAVRDATSCCRRSRRNRFAKVNKLRTP